VRHAAILRFLDLLCKELGADDARVEIGGRDPEDPRLLWLDVEGGFRLVLVFKEIPAGRAFVQQRLVQLAAGFAHTVHDVQLPSPPPTSALDSPVKRLDAALEALRSRAGGVSVVVFDENSPVLWGSSAPERQDGGVDTLVRIGDALQEALSAGVDLDAICALRVEDVPMRLRDLGIDGERAELLGHVFAAGDETSLRHHLLTCLAIARARAEAESAPRTARWAHHETQFGYFARKFANIYLLVVVFEGAFSELYVESAVVHALPTIEQLLLALPPDPGPVARGGRVIRLRR
jgi:hypothetical protein